MKSKKGNGKLLENSKIYAIIIILFVVGSSILIFSDTFYQPEVSNVNNSSFSNNQNQSNVNLSQLQEINRFEDILKSNPDDYNSLLKLGHLYSDNGFYKKAIDKYNEYLVKFPEAVDVIVDKGFCFFELKQFSKAIESFQLALDKNPKHQIANFNMGIVLFNTGNKDEAKKYFKIASEINPESQIGKRAINLLNQ